MPSGQELDSSKDEEKEEKMRARPGSAASALKKKKKKSKDQHMEVLASFVEHKVPHIAENKQSLTPYVEHKLPISPDRRQKAEFNENYAKLDQERLLGELYNCKKLLIKQDGFISTLKGENQRWENEVWKQQRRIDRLLESINKNSKDGIASADDIRKEIEKSIVVRQLKQQISILKTSIVDKETELETLARNQKNSRLLELVAENAEYMNEINRLKDVNKKLIHEINKSKGSTAKLEKEQKESSAVTNSLYKVGNSNMFKNSNTMNRPQSAKTVSNNSSSSHNSSHSNSNVQPLIIVKSKSTANIVTLNNNAPKEFVDTTTNIEQLRAGKSSDSNSKSTIDRVPIVLGSAHVVTSESNSNIESLYKVGDKVQGMFRGGTTFYNATIKGDLGNNVYHLMYDDGDEERAVKTDRIRAIPVNNVVKVDLSLAKFKVNDEIEALYYNGSTYYKGKIKSVNCDKGSFVYNIQYNDGEKENKVPENRIKLSVDQQVTAAHAPAPLPVPQVASGDDHIPTENSLDNLDGTIDAIEAEGGIYEVEAQLAEDEDYAGDTFDA